VYRCPLNLKEAYLKEAKCQFDGEGRVFLSGESMKVSLKIGDSLLCLTEYTISSG